MSAYDDMILAETPRPPVGYWSGNDASGDNVDSSGNGYNAAQNGFGTVTYSVASILTNGVGDLCTQYGTPADPTNSSIHAEFDGIGEATIECWFYRENNGSGQGTGSIMCGFDAGAGGAFGWQWDADNTMSWYAQNAGGQYKQATVAVFGLIHAVFVYESGAAAPENRGRMYINNVERVGGGGSDFGTTLGASLGSFQLNGVLGAHSSQANVKRQKTAIYDHALNTTQIGNHYTAGTVAAGGVGRLINGGLVNTGLASGRIVR